MKIEVGKIKFETKAMLGFIVLIFMCISIGIWLGMDVLSNTPQGIGGFVYQEIEWAQQTYNVVSNCQNLDGKDVPVLFYDDDVKQFYCIEKIGNCDTKGCYLKKKYLNVKIQK